MHIYWVVRLCCVFILGLSLQASADSSVTFENQKNGTTILIDEIPVMEYVWQDAQVPRPYFKQLTTMDGIPVSRTYPPDPVTDEGNYDHSTYHPGSWMAFGDINGADFWRNKAKVDLMNLSLNKTNDGLIANYTYKTNEKEYVCSERREYIFSKEKHGYLMRVQSTFSSKKGDFAFGDQEEMGFGVRLATGLRVRGGNGAMRNSEGGVNEAGTWGKSADWLAGYGSVDGQGVGMMVVADPANFRKSWFHSRDYGLIVANPFGKKAMTGPKDDAVKNDSTLVKKGEKLIVGFGVYVFNYAANGEPDFDEMYADYLKRNDGD